MEGEGRHPDVKCLPILPLHLESTPEEAENKGVCVCVCVCGVCVCVCVWLTTCTLQETVVRRDCCTERQDSWGTALAPEERKTCYNLQTYMVELHLY